MKGGGISSERDRTQTPASLRDYPRLRCPMEVVPVQIGQQAHEDSASAKDVWPLILHVRLLLVGYSNTLSGSVPIVDDLKVSVE